MGKAVQDLAPPGLQVGPRGGDMGHAPTAEASLSLREGPQSLRASQRCSSAEPAQRMDWPVHGHRCSSAEPVQHMDRGQCRSNLVEASLPTDSAGNEGHVSNADVSLCLETLECRALGQCAGVVPLQQDMDNHSEAAAAERDAHGWCKCGVPLPQHTGKHLEARGANGECSSSSLSLPLTDDDVISSYRFSLAVRQQAYDRGMAAPRWARLLMSAGTGVLTRHAPHLRRVLPAPDGAFSPCAAVGMTLGSAVVGCGGMPRTLSMTSEGDCCDGGLTMDSSEDSGDRWLVHRSPFLLDQGGAAAAASGASSWSQGGAAFLSSGLVASLPTICE